VNTLSNNPLLSLATLFIGIMSLLVTYKTCFNEERAKTSRLCLEKVYIPVFSIIEKDLFQPISYSDAVKYGDIILSILESNPGYYYPSLKLYTERLINAEYKDYQDRFITVCDSVNRSLDKYSYYAGFPQRSFVYRFAKKQYQSPWELVMPYLRQYGLLTLLWFLLFVLVCFLAK